MKDFEIKLKGFGRGFGGYPDILNKSDVIAWKSAENLLNKFEYSENSSKITLFFDWSEVVQEVEEAYRVESMSKEEFEKWTPSRSELERYPKVLCRIHSNSQNLITDSSIANRYWAYALRAIYESFIILNLSSPGSFNFLTCQFELDYSHEINPSAYFFEDAWHESLVDGWPQISFIEPEKVINWIRTLKIGDVEFAKSKIARCIYALIHASLHPANELSTIMWIAYALEALYETPVGQSFTVLFTRIQNLLSIPDNKRKKIKSKLRDFYDERHKFAHGGAPIVHPVEDYGLDSEAGKYVYSIQLLNSFAFSIALATIQKCIIEAWSGLDFHETMQGRPMHKT